MATDLNKTSLTTDFAELFGAPPVLSTRRPPQSYDAMLARILQFLKASDFINQMLGQDLTDATLRGEAVFAAQGLRNRTEEAEEAEQLEDTIPATISTGERLSACASQSSSRRRPRFPCVCR